MSFDDLCIELYLVYHRAGYEARKCCLRTCPVFTFRPGGVRRERTCCSKLESSLSLVEENMAQRWAVALGLAVEGTIGFYGRATAIGRAACEEIENGMTRDGRRGSRWTSLPGGGGDI